MICFHHSYNYSLSRKHDYFSDSLIPPNNERIGLVETFLFLSLIIVTPVNSCFYHSNSTDTFKRKINFARLQYTKVRDSVTTFTET